jgi:hypothetical protein
MSFEIMFEDLSVDTQERFLKFSGYESFEKSNLEITPIAIIELEDKKNG